MTTLLGGALISLVILALTSVVSVFLAYLVIEMGDVSMAAAKTGRRFRGVLAGAGSVIVVGLALGVDVVLQAPELVITLLGIGSIFAGVSWPMFGATAFVTWALAESANGGPR